MAQLYHAAWFAPIPLRTDRPTVPAHPTPCPGACPSALSQRLPQRVVAALASARCRSACLSAPPQRRACGLPADLVGYPPTLCHKVGAQGTRSAHKAQGRRTRHKVGAQGTRSTSRTPLHALAPPRAHARLHDEHTSIRSIPSRAHALDERTRRERQHDGRSARAHAPYGRSSTTRWTGRTDENERARARTSWRGRERTRGGVRMPRTRCTRSGRGTPWASCRGCGRSSA